ncbi:MAG: RNA 3'-terminal phosphate cyclase [Candidatus Aenigmarchaeota archaeon]|nr:RNA 3'-terminal phosphate cyclase [Candidatus Aenigmarchaeota archaeon]
MIEIPGDYGEGGGQIIRTAIALSAVTGKPCRISSIRAKRAKPGLQTQHLEGVKALAKLCGADVKGAHLGSTELAFSPQKIKGGNISISIPTAGSTGLVLQGLMIAAIHADKAVNISISGGATNGKWAMPLNYAKQVLLPLLGKMGYKAEIDVERYGYYPKGGAVVSVVIEPCKLSPLVLLERGEIVSVNGVSHASKELTKNNVAERQQKAARDVIFKELKITADVRSRYNDTACPGSAIDLWAKCENSVLGSDGLGERGKRAEDVGKEAAEKLVQQLRSGAAVDEHAEDQLIPYMALAAESGTSSIKVPVLTEHTQTNIWVVEKFLDVKFEMEGSVLHCKKL